MKNFMLVVVLITGLVFVSNGAADPVETSEIEKRLFALENEMLSLKQELEKRKSAEQNKKEVSDDGAIVTANTKDGFSIKTKDGSFRIKLRGLIQADGRVFTDKPSGATTKDTFTMRRVRPTIEGQVGRLYSFYVTPEFGNGSSTILDAYAEIAFSDTVKLRGGKFLVPFGIEVIQSSAATNFIERGLPNNLSPSREVGFQVHGNIARGKVYYALGLFNGTADRASAVGLDSDNNNDKDVIARIFAYPFQHTHHDSLKGLGLGLAATYGHKDGNTLPTYRSAGQAGIFSYVSGVAADGAHSRVTPQMYYYYKSFGLLGEFIQSRQKVTRSSSGMIFRDSFAHRGWQVAANYVLTGEDASYRGIVPVKNFDPQNQTWGAFEIVARYDSLSLDENAFDRGFASLASSVKKADSWGVGGNWYLHKSVRLSLNYFQTHFEGGAASGDRPTENVIMTRMQLSY